MEASRHQHEEYAEETALAQRVARIFGYEGLDIQIQPGAGWKTIKEENRVTLVVDPSMLQPETLKDASGEDLPEDTHIPEQYSVYGTAHELGHVEDFMQPESDLEELKAMKPSEHFFWNVVDDAVINRRLRNIPLLNSLTDTIYDDMLFPKNDYSKMPKHVQLMYGWLLRNVTPNRAVTLSDDVTEALDGLESMKIGLRRYDLPRTLAHPDTDYGKRKDIAGKHVWPVYEQFLEEDRQNKSDQDQQTKQNEDQQSSPIDEIESPDSGCGSGDDTGGDGEDSRDSIGQSDEQPGEGGGSQGSDVQPDQTEGSGDGEDWEDIYDAYSDVSHCGHQDYEDKTEDHDHGDQSNSNDTDPHDAIREAAEALREVIEEGTEGSEDDQAQAAGDQSGNIAGSIAAELKLSPEDAAAYQAMIQRYRSQIRGIAKVFQQLTVPTVEYTSPRYQRRSDTSGLKLSPRDLFQVVVAQHSEVDPAVWKPIETVSKREGFSFNGLDIHIVVDSSASMQGQKADSAAACSVMLMEGLASARRMVERHNPQAPKPDVRLQVMVFGSSAKVVARLSHETEAKDKGIAFTTVRDARSGSTLVTDALRQTVNDGNAHPERTQLVYLVTDGDIHDRVAAGKALEGANQNYFLCQYILQSPHSSPITTQAAHINDPAELPGQLNRQLQSLASKFFI